MTTERPYQSAMKFEDALLRIKSLTGTRYDPNVVAAFYAACESGQIAWLCATETPARGCDLNDNVSDFSRARPQRLRCGCLESCLSSSHSIQNPASVAHFCWDA